MNKFLGQLFRWLVVLFRKVVGRKYYTRCVRVLLEEGKEYYVLDDNVHFGTRLSRFGCTVFVSAGDRAVGRSMVEKGRYESHFTGHFCRFLKEDTRLIDIGANIGYFSLITASQCPRARVFSFEPDKRNFSLLERSISHNGFEDIIRAHPCAVSDKEETLLISDLSNPGNYGARATARDRQHMENLIPGTTPTLHEVRAVRLDDFLPEERVDLIKMDIEGYEPVAFRGMEGLIRKNRPVVFMEFAPNNLQLIGNTSPHAFLAYLASLGYEIRVIRKSVLAEFGNDPARIMAYFEARKKKQHLDLVLTPR